MLVVFAFSVQQIQVHFQLHFLVMMFLINVYICIPRNADGITA